MTQNEQKQSQNYKNDPKRLKRDSPSLGVPRGVGAFNLPVPRGPFPYYLSMLFLLSVSKGVKLAEAEPGAAEELIGYLEAAVTDSLEQKGVSR